MPIEIKEVKTAKDLKKFVFLTEKMNAHRPGWVPPIYSDDLRVLNPKKNPAHAYCDSILLLAYDGNDLVGRVAGIINNRYNEYAGMKTARFSFFEAPDRIEVSRALLEYVEKWARSKGMNLLVGPQGFTEEDSEGFIYEGYDETPTIGCIQNPPYVNEHMEKLGFGKEIDWFVYKIDIAKAMSDTYAKFFERASRNKAFRLVEFKKKSQLKPYIHPIFELMNSTFSVLYGYSPLDEHEVESMADRYMPLLDHRFIKAAVTPENEVVGFIVSIPNMSQGMIKARGRILPFGILHILRSAKKTDQLDNYLGAVKEEYRGKGVDVLIGYAQLKEASNAGLKVMDSHHELEDNVKVRAENERVGGVIYKKYRLYSMKL
jgi:predicted GNAT family acetyltransferase